jgi:hypothetical protein
MIFKKQLKNNKKWKHHGQLLGLQNNKQQYFIIILTIETPNLIPISDGVAVGISISDKNKGILADFYYGRHNDDDEVVICEQNLLRSSCF